MKPRQSQCLTVSRSDHELRAPRDGACLDVDDVAAFLHRRLDAASVYALDQHVAACVACRELLSALAQDAPEIALATPDVDTGRWTNELESVAFPALSSSPPAPSTCDHPASLLARRATLGAYRLLDTLGEGGMGTVYLAEHTLLHRKAAIKVVRSSLSEDEATVTRFFHEARAVSRIADPGIVQIFDFGYHTDGSAFIVMELLEGEAMDRRLARIGQFSARDCLRLMRMICTSLAAVHAQGIVHRDLKPANLFFVADPAMAGGERVKILDFGIAKLASHEAGGIRTPIGATVGTPAYMSPEQCRGSRLVDHRADIYSIACVMFTMLTGRPPFDGKGPGDLFAAHLCELPPLASSRVPALPEAIDQILERCLRKSVDDRFASISELVAALDAAERALEASTAPALTTLGRAGGEVSARPAARTPRRFAAGLAVATLAVAAVSAAAVVALRSGGAASSHAASAAAPAPSPLRTAAPAPAPAAAAPSPAFAAPAPSVLAPVPASSVPAPSVPAPVPAPSVLTSLVPASLVPAAAVLPAPTAPAAPPLPATRTGEGATRPRKRGDRGRAANPLPVDRSD